MKTFSDLEFKSHPMGSEFGVRSRITFDNGFGVSVVRSEFSYGGRDGLYELAVLGTDGSMSYDTPITDDVIGYLSEEVVTEIMRKIQELGNKDNCEYSGLPSVKSYQNKYNGEDSN